MKKMLSIIIAVCIMTSSMVFATTSASAVTTDKNTLGIDVDIWNHEFKNEISGEVIWAIDEIEDNDTVGVTITLWPENVDYDDIDVFAEKNNRLDEVIYDEYGEITDTTEELEDDYWDYVYEILNAECEKEREIVNGDYCVSEIYYLKSYQTMFCEATKEQIVRLADAEIDVSINLADKDYYNETFEITWDEFKNIVNNSRLYIEENYGVQCSEDVYDVVMYRGFFNDVCMIDVSEIALFGSDEVVMKRTDNLMWQGSTGASSLLFYDEGKIKNLPEMYIDGSLTDEEFYQLGGRFYCDIDNDKLVDVKDVTELQLILAGAYDSEFSEYYQNSMALYQDVNFDGNVDVKDVTTVQMYIAGYDV